MNWLDEYLAINDEGYFKSDDGSYWVKVSEDVVRIAIGEGEPRNLKEVSRNEFIRKLIGGI